MAGSLSSREQSGEKGTALLRGVPRLRQPFGGLATLCGQGHSGRSRGALWRAPCGYFYVSTCLGRAHRYVVEHQSGCSWEGYVFAVINI